MIQDFICECNCDSEITCEDGVCLKGECDTDDCRCVCLQESDDYALCCGDGCCNTTYEEFAC